MMLPDVSVIVTCYNYGRFLERCLRSLLNQEHVSRFSYEIVLVDDGSDDNTPLVVNKFTPLFENLKYVRNAKNQGLPNSCNIGITNSIGRYVVRVDADDWINRHFLFMLKFALDKNRGFQAFCCDYFEVDSLENNIRQVSWMEEEIACAIMYRKECLEDVGLYNESFQYREGHELKKRFLKQYQIGYLPIPLYHVRKHNNNRSNNEAVKEFDNKLTDLE